MTSKSATVLIIKARKVDEPKFDASEEVVVELVPSEDVLGLIKTGAIGHALTVAGLFWWLIAEIPGTPLAQPAAIKPKVQFRIKTLLAIIAVCALFLSLLPMITPLMLPMGISAVMFAALLFVLVRFSSRLGREILPGLSSSVVGELKRTRGLLLAMILVVAWFFIIAVWMTIMLKIFYHL